MPADHPGTRGCERRPPNARQRAHANFPPRTALDPYDYQLIPQSETRPHLHSRLQGAPSEPARRRRLRVHAARMCAFPRPAPWMVRLFPRIGIPNPKVCPSRSTKSSRRSTSLTPVAVLIFSPLFPFRMSTRISRHTLTRSLFQARVTCSSSLHALRTVRRSHGPVCQSQSVANHPTPIPHAPVVSCVPCASDVRRPPARHTQRNVLTSHVIPLASHAPPSFVCALHCASARLTLPLRAPASPVACPALFDPEEARGLPWPGVSDARRVTLATRARTHRSHACLLG